MQSKFYEYAPDNLFIHFIYLFFCLMVHQPSWSPWTLKNIPVINIWTSTKSILMPKITGGIKNSFSWVVSLQNSSCTITYLPSQKITDKRRYPMNSNSLWVFDTVYKIYHDLYVIGTDASDIYIYIYIYIERERASRESVLSTLFDDDDRKYLWTILYIIQKNFRIFVSRFVSGTGHLRTVLFIG